MGEIGRRKKGKFSERAEVGIYFSQEDIMTWWGFFKWKIYDLLLYSIFMQTFAIGDWRPFRIFLI